MSATAPIPLMQTPIQLTTEAADRIKAVMEQENLQAHGLRIGVIGGGCSGLQYLLDFSEHSEEDDFVDEQYGIPVFVDPYSAAHLKGTTINFVDSLHGTGFKFENPNIVRSCGCGSSFST